MAMRWRWPPENWCGSGRAARPIHPDARQHGFDLGPAFGGVRRRLHQVEGLGHQIFHPPARIEAAVGILEDGLDVAAHAAGLDIRRGGKRPDPRDAPLRPAGAPDPGSRAARSTFRCLDSPTSPTVSPARTSRPTPSDRAKRQRRLPRRRAGSGIGANDRLAPSGREVVARGAPAARPWPRRRRPPVRFA